MARKLNLKPRPSHKSPKPAADKSAVKAKPATKSAKKPPVAAVPPIVKHVVAAKSKQPTAARLAKQAAKIKNFDKSAETFTDRIQCYLRAVAECGATESKPVSLADMHAKFGSHLSYYTAGTNNIGNTGAYSRLVQLGYLTSSADCSSYKLTKLGASTAKALVSKRFTA